MSTKLLTVADFRARAERRLPKVVFDYVDGGAETEQTECANRRAFEEVFLRPKMATSGIQPDLRTSLFDLELSMPLILAPCGMARIVDPSGDAAAAKAAGEAGVAFTLASRSGHSIEEIAASSTGPVWFQVYDVSGKAAVEQAIERAVGAGCRALVLTFDTAVHGARERDARNGIAPLLHPNRLRALPYLPGLMRKPCWFAKRLGDGLIPKVPNVVDPNGAGQRLSGYERVRSLTFKDVSWVRALWPGPLLIKGIVTEEVARRAVDHGADGVVVSNHGGRQLDGAPATLRALPRIVAAIDGRCEVLLDGGIRRGSDVVKALSLGAGAVLMGRPWMYALGAVGPSGVSDVLSILRADIERTLTLMGCESLSELQRASVSVPRSWDC